MPIKWSQTLIPTAREVPADAEVPSHRLMLRAGCIHRLGSGVYDYLPLGLRSLRKVMQIVREEMDAAGAVEVFLPTLQPVELWERTGRRTDYGPNLFVIEDRHGRQHALGPTHEEVMTELVGAHIDSYKQVPLTLYQIQTKFRDEFRPRFGVLRSREFQMKDAYSFDLSAEALDASYQKQYDAYCRIFARCGLPYEIVEAESGPIGGSASHEFMVPSPTGEDTILKSDKGNYAANVEKCAVGARAADLEAAPAGTLERLHTPGCPGIADVVAFVTERLGTPVTAQQMLKTLVCESPKGVVVAVVRGDHELNEAKLRAACGHDAHLAEDELLRKSHFAIGFVGPQVAVERGDIRVVVDPDAAQGGPWVTGANEIDHHVRNFNWKRDLLDVIGAGAAQRVSVADIRNAVDGDPSPRDDGGVLRETKGIEVGHVFKLGTKYTEALGVEVLDEQNQRRPLVMGCYGIGLNRIVASAIEREGGHDEHGIVWPAAIAPFAVLVTPIKYDGAAREAADRVAEQLEREHGLDVLIDDRAERPGVKFNDADLVGIPVRITVGDKGLKEGALEVKARDGSNGDRGEKVPVDQAAARVAEMVARL